jgi:hypothetical protein
LSSTIRTANARLLKPISKPSFRTTTPPTGSANLSPASIYVSVICTSLTELGLTGMRCPHQTTSGTQCKLPRRGGITAECSDSPHRAEDDGGSACRLPVEASKLLSTSTQLSPFNGLELTTAAAIAAIFALPSLACPCSKRRASNVYGNFIIRFVRFMSSKTWTEFELQYAPMERQL